MSYTWRMILPGQFLDPQSPRYLRPPLRCLQTLCGCRGASTWQTNSSIANITNIIHRAQWQCNYIFMIKSIDQFQSSSTLPPPVTQLFSISWCDRWAVIPTTPSRPPFNTQIIIGNCRNNHGGDNYDDIIVHKRVWAIVSRPSIFKISTNFNFRRDHV